MSYCKNHVHNEKMFREEMALSYDDVLIVPEYSTLTSRTEADLSCKLGNLTLKYPIMSAAMDTVTGANMARELGLLGGMGIIHRFQSVESRLEEINNSKQIVTQEEPDKIPVGVAIGLKDSFDDCIRLANVSDVLAMDIAHADCEEIVRFIKELRPQMPHHCSLMVGNVATRTATSRLVKAGADIVKVGIGGGCFAAGTRILMSNGFYKNIEDVVAGDRIINKEGQPATVKKSFCSGVKKVIKIKNSLSPKDTIVTDDHRFWVGDLNSTSQTTLSSRGYSKLLDLQEKTIPKQSKYKWKQIGNTQQDVLLVPRKLTLELEETFDVPIKIRDGGNGTNNVVDKIDTILKPSYELGYIFGTFLGDGTSHCHYNKNKKSNSGRVNWYSGLEETKYVEKITEYVNIIFNRDVVVKTLKNNCKQVTLYHKPFADFLQSFGKKENKHLPENLFVKDTNYLNGIYDGLIDSDGHYGDDGRNSFYNTSIQLIELFNILNYIIKGYFPNSSSRGISHGTLENINQGNFNESFQSRTLKNNKVRFTKDYYVSKILKKEEMNLELPVYDLEIDDETHSFIADNVIVHNSACSTRVVTGFGVPNVTAIMDARQALKELGAGDHVSIVADGGIRNSADIAKAMAAGANCVMLGSLLAGTSESPGNVETNSNGDTFKMYRGMASNSAQVDFKGKLTEGTVAEGVSTLIPFKGPVRPIVEELMGGIRSSFSYGDARSWEEFYCNTSFVRVSKAAVKESVPHILSSHGHNIG